MNKVCIRKRTTGALLAFIVTHHIVSAQPSGSVTQGLGNVIVTNMMPACPSNHITPLGIINSSDGKTWDVPAPVNFYSATGLTDLYNPCTGVTPPDLSQVDLTTVPVHVIDVSGDTITGFLFCDNYFELYINGILIGVDPVPFTPFNSCIVRFKVSRPYTIAVKLVDWEEHLGIGTEIQPADSFHLGDGGFIAQFSDGTVTDSTWKAQAFYIAPIENLNDVVELPDSTHSTANATLTPSCGSNCFGVHYPIDTNWIIPSFNDSYWPKAHLYTAAQVTNQPAYLNFSGSAWGSADFIWSSNLILDNLVLTRKTVSSILSANATEEEIGIMSAGLMKDELTIMFTENLMDAVIELSDLTGKFIGEWKHENLTAFHPLDLKLNTVLQHNEILFLNVHNEKVLKTEKLIYNGE